MQYLNKIIKINIVVEDLGQSLKNYLKLGFFGPWAFFKEKNDLKLIYKLNNIYIELIQPCNNISIFNNYLKKFGGGFHHLSFHVNNFDMFLQDIKLIDTLSDEILKSNLNFDCFYLDCKDTLTFDIEFYKNIPDFSINVESLNYLILKNKEKIYIDNEQEKIFGNLTQIGIIVRDLEKTVKKYSELIGLTPWKVYKFTPDRIKNMTVNGKCKNHSFIVACININEIELELIQPLDNSVYTEHLEYFGEGLHHVCFSTTDYSYTMNFLVKKGLRIIQSGNWNDYEYIYFSSFKDLGFIIELYHCPIGWVAAEADFYYA